MHRSGSLPYGHIEELHVRLDLETSISRLAFVEVTYTSDASPELPRHLVVKLPLTPRSTPGDGMGEPEFYRRLAPLAGTPPLVRCVAALEPGGDDPEVLVLEDLRATHDHPPWPIPPSPAQCELAVDVLARIHARWWEAPTLGRGVGQPHTSESLRTMVQGIAAKLPDFFAAVGDGLSTDARRILERVFSSSLRPWLRLTDTRSLTVIHGDAHTWNFLFPRSGDGPAFLIDWQLWHVDVGARDLAFFMALHWYPRQRRELEEMLLRRYHRALEGRGVDNYSFSELMLDYRRCVVRNLTIPILFWSRGMKPEGWWHRLECALSAYSDLSCEELL
jgi:phosphotransferase family enzyme